MKIEIKVPAMGESITEATVGQLLKAESTTVAMDDELLELETDKVNQVIYAPKAGKVLWQVKTGDTVTIDQVLGYIDTEALATSAPAKETSQETKSATTSAQPTSPKTSEAAKAPVASSTPPETTAAPTPVQQSALSKPKEVEKGSLRIQQSDFVAELKNPVSPAKESSASQPSKAATPRPEEGQRETRQRMPRIRQVIAQRLVAAQQQSAMLTTFNEVDMTQVMEQRKLHKDAFQEKYGVKLGMMSFFVKAVVAALQQSPQLNSYIDGEDLVQRHYYDIGIAVGTPRGLVVPVLRSCDTLSFAQIEQAIVDFAVKAKGGKLAVEDLQGGGFTITNGGVYGSLLSTPILNPPQCGILGMHKIQERPVALNGAVVIRPMMYLALSYDHRIIDGKEAVTFLVHIKETLEDLTKILLEI